MSVASLWVRLLIVVSAAVFAAAAFAIRAVSEGPLGQYWQPHSNLPMHGLLT